VEKKYKLKLWYKPKLQWSLVGNYWNIVDIGDHEWSKNYVC